MIRSLETEKQVRAYGRVQNPCKNRAPCTRPTAKHAKTPESTEAPATTPTPEAVAAEKKDTHLRFIFRELITGLKPAIPELLLKEEARLELEKLVRDLSQIKISLDDYLARRQMNFDQLSTELATQVLGQLQLEFILEALGQHLKLKIADADYQEYWKRIEDEKTREAYQKDPQYLAYLTRVISRQKVIDHLLSL